MHLPDVVGDLRDSENSVADPDVEFPKSALRPWVFIVFKSTPRDRVEFQNNLTEVSTTATA